MFSGAEWLGPESGIPSRRARKTGRPFAGVRGGIALPIARTRLPPGIAVPNGDFVCFAVLLIGVHPALLADALAAIRDVDAMCREAGGTRYLSG